MPDLADVAGQLEMLLQKWERKESARWTSPFNEKAYVHARTLLTAAIYELADTIATGGKVTDAAQSTAVAVVDRPRVGIMRPIGAPAAILAAQEETRQLVKEIMVEGRDYGLIPGVKKPSLLKPGAERVGMAFGCFPRYRILEAEIDHDRKVEWRKKKRVYNNAHRNDKSYREEETTGESLGLYRYVVDCELVHREAGQVVGHCIGVCSTMESKYVDRPRDSENTALKIAEKRAHVGAALNAFGLSEQFTQDVEDNPQAAAAEDVSQEPITRDSVVDWGKFKDNPTSIAALPDGYIKWAAEDGRKFGPRTEEWQKVFRAELDLRDLKKDAKNHATTETVTDADLEEDRRPAHAGAVDESFPSALEETDDDLPF